MCVREMQLTLGSRAFADCFTLPETLLSLFAWLTYLHFFSLSRCFLAEAFSFPESESRPLVTHSQSPARPCSWTTQLHMSVAIECPSLSLPLANFTKIGNMAIVFVPFSPVLKSMPILKYLLNELINSVIK